VSGLRHLADTSTLTGGGSYFDYQRRVAKEAILPWLAARLPLASIDVADFGSHSGGMIDVLREDGRVRSALGFELNRDVVAESPLRPDPLFRLTEADLLRLDAHEEFDLVLACEVLEHVPATAELLRVARRALRPRGHMLVTFPPFWSPFGGHQQLASTAVRLVPYLQYAGRYRFLKLARLQDTNYMSAETALEDVTSVFATKLTLRRAERAFHAEGFRLADRTLWLLRPEYRVRYGVRPLGAGPLGTVPVVREALVTGAYYLLERSP